MEVTEKDYIENRVMVEYDHTLWDTYRDGNIALDTLLNRIYLAKKEILSEYQEVDEGAMYLDIYTYDGGAELDLYYERFETKDEYERRLVSEESSRQAYLGTLKHKMRENFDDACRILEELKEELQNKG